MKVVMDRVGRIVVPKTLRDQLGLEPEAEFDAVIDGTAIRLQPRQTSERVINHTDGWPVLSRASSVVLTDQAVRDLRDAGQR